MRNSSKRETVQSPIAKLSFVASRDGKQLPKYTSGQLPRCFWNVASTGNDRQDGLLGRRLGLEYLAFEAADIGGSGHLASIVADMPRELTAIEISFLAMVSYAAGAGVQRAQRVSAYWNSAIEMEAA